MRQKSFHGYTVKCVETREGWIGLIYPPGSTGAALGALPRATVIEGEPILLRRAAQAIDDHRARERVVH